MKRFLTLWSIILLVTVTLIEVAPQSAGARKLKVYSLPKEIAPGQLGILIFDNPTLGVTKSQSKCVGEKLMGWIKSDIPILRFEQNGKQVWMPLISYQTLGDSSIATFMAPPSLEAGRATVYLINDHDVSIPYSLGIIKEIHASLRGRENSDARPGAKLTLIGDGFVPEGSIDIKKATDELETNIGFSKLSKAEQWKALNKRILKDWDKIPSGNFLTIKQNGKTWRVFADGCGVDIRGQTRDYTLPPDLVAGQAIMGLLIRLGGMDVLEVNPIPVEIIP